MDEILIAELQRLMRSPRVRRDPRKLTSHAPRLESLALATLGGSVDPVPRVQRLLNAGAARVEPLQLRRAVLAYWALPPFGALESAEARQVRAASNWAEDFSHLSAEDRAAAERKPVAANTLRSAAYKRYFAEALASALEAVVAETGRGRRSAYVPDGGLGTRNRPKLPTVVTQAVAQTVWLDDEGRKIRTRYQIRHLAMEPTNGIQRLVVVGSYAGYRRTVGATTGCELQAEQELNNNMRRLIFRLPALDPGQEHLQTFELTTAFDADAPMPADGSVIADEINDDFEAHIAVHFGARRPAAAWYFDDLPPVLLPGEPRPSRLLGLDVEGRLVHNFFPPTNARKCYGLAWQF